MADGASKATAKAFRESELKLSVDDPFVTPQLAQADTGIAGMHELPAQDLRATYYDTSDLRLARNGVTLRYRSGEDGRSRWTLKLPVAADHTLERDELSFDGGARTVPAQARVLVKALTRGADLGPVARLRTRRRRWSLRDAGGGELAELVDDRVSVLQRNRVVGRFRELEVEARSLERHQLAGIGAVLRRAGAAPTKTPKALRALGARALAPPDVVAPERLSPGEPAAFAVQAAIAHGLERIIVNDAGTRLGDAESLHQMRVGTRRLRSDLRTFSELVDAGWAAGLTTRLRDLGATLGDVRDLDVLIARLTRSCAGIEPSLGELFDELEARRIEARQRLVEVLDDPGYIDLLDSLVEAARDPKLTPSAWVPSEKALPQLAAEAATKLVRTGQRLGDTSPDSDYHEVRKLAKRARYAAEAIAPAIDQRAETERFAKQAARVQSLLGDMQDAAVAGDLIDEFVAHHSDRGELCFAAGQLLERERGVGRLAREHFPKAWKKLRRARPKNWTETPA